MRVFVGSSGPNLPLAHALQHYLQGICLLTVWDQRVVRPSQFPFAELARQAEQTDYAIFVAGYDEKRTSRSSPPHLINQNVVLELGLFAGLLGLDRVFLLVPNDFSKQLQVPSDLHGLTLIPYDARRLELDGNTLAAIGPAASQIRTSIERLNSQPRTSSRVEARLFPDWTDTFQEALQQTNTLSVCFVHSRRWRENHGDTVFTRAKEGKISCEMFVPDIREPQLIKDLTARFDDGPSIPAMIADLMEWIVRLQTRAPRTRIHLMSRFPAYSFYRFGDFALVALYPLSTERQPSPTVRVDKASSSWMFLERDRDELVKEFPVVPLETLKDSLHRFRADWLKSSPSA